MILIALRITDKTTGVLSNLHVCWIWSGFYQIRMRLNLFNNSSHIQGTMVKTFWDNLRSIRCGFDIDEKKKLSALTCPEFMKNLGSKILQMSNEMLQAEKITKELKRVK